MAITISVNIPDALATVVTQSLCIAGGFAEVSDANAKQAVIDWITATVANVQTPVVPPASPAPIQGLS